MSELLRWPAEFPDPQPETEFHAEHFALLEQMVAAGTSVYANCTWSLFGFQRCLRSVEFIRRGNGRKVGLQFRVNRETYWEVLLTNNGLPLPLGPVFGIGHSACVVVCGIADITSISQRWLGGAAVTEVVGGVSLWDRLDPSLPLVVVV